MQNENKKFPVLAMILTFIGLFLAVVCASTGIYLASYRTAGTTALALLAIVITVLFIAGLTASKNVLLRVVSIIVTVSLVVISFVVSLVDLSGGNNTPVLRTSILFAISLLMLICAVLEMIYFFMNKNDRITAMYKFSGYTFSVLTAIYAVVYIISDYMYVDKFNGNNTASMDLSFNIYFLTFALAVISLIPLVSFKLLNPEVKKEEPKQIDNSQE
jgi:hypothetical protein